MFQVGISELKNLFVDADNYEVDESKDLDNENDSSKDYYLFVATNDSKSTICKIYDPNKLITIDTKLEKKQQGWYRQLMIFRECFLLRRFQHPAIAEFRGINLFNSSLIYDEYKELFMENFENEEEEEEKKEPIYTNPIAFLEYISNGSLETYISKQPAEFLTPAQRQICILGLTSAVNYLHTNNIIHRSINPKTIWFDEHKYPKLFDFSTTREMENDSNSDQTEVYFDSILYIAPEILNKVGIYDNSIDIFALGRIIYYFITGFQPYKYKKIVKGKKIEDPNKNSNKFDFIKLFSQGVPPLMPKSIPPKLKELLLRCWSVNPSDRPTSTELLYNFLNNDDCLISELTNPDQLKEYNEYRDKIQNFEDTRENLEIVSNKNLELSIAKTLDFEELFEEDERNLTYHSKEDEKTQLEKVIKSNFKYNNEEIFKLLLQMANDKTIMEKNYLSQVINYANKQNLKQFPPAEAFLKAIFGDYINVSRDVHELTSDIMKKNNSIEKANIPPWITKIKKGAFKGFTNLKRVNIPESVRTIDDEAFYGCTNLDIVNIPTSIERDKLGKKVFMNCTSLQYIKTPPNLTTIKEMAFKNDKALKNVDLNLSLRVIEREAFYNCISLYDQKLPSTLSKIGKKAFEKDKS